MAKNLMLTLSFLYSGFFISAQEDKIDTDRPDQTESAAIVPKNYFQAEIGFNKENTFGRNYDIIHPTALLKYGLNKFELRLETVCRSSYEHFIPNPKWTTGFDPIEIGFKASLAEEKKMTPSTSFIVHVGVPALSSKAFRSDHLAPSFRLLLQKGFTDFLGVGSNLGAEWDGFSSIPIWLYTFSPGFNIGEKWYAYIEVFGFIQKNELPQHNIDGGIAYYISKDVKIDVSSGCGISKASPKNYLAVGVSFRVNTKRCSNNNDQ
jgi:hypothetical protein